jgi:hypothetical protein
MIYIVRYDGYYGSGTTLKDAYEELIEDYSGYIDLEEIEFFECTKIEAEITVSKKS